MLYFIPLINLTKWEMENDSLLVKYKNSSIVYNYTILDEEDNEFIETWTPATIFLLIVLVAFNIWSVFTNFVLLIVLWRKECEYGGANSTDLYLINICFIDICSGIFVIPFMTIVVVSGYWPLGSSACAVWVYFDYFSIVVSAYGYAALLVNHLIMVISPRSCRNSTEFHLVVIGCLWIMSKFSWIPAFIHHLGSFEWAPHFCGYEMEATPYYSIYVGLTGFYIPFLVSISSGIYSTFRLQMEPNNKLFYNTGSQNISQNGTVSSKPRNWTFTVIMEANHALFIQNQAKKEHSLIVTMLALFCITRILFYIYFCVGTFLVKIFPPDLSDGLYWLIHFNGAICPILHVLLDEELRQAFKDLSWIQYILAKAKSIQDTNTSSSVPPLNSSTFV